MQKTVNTFKAVRLMGVFFLATAMLISCENKDSKKTEVESTQVTTDTLPALDKDSLISDRPETIKN